MGVGASLAGDNDCYHDQIVREEGQWDVLSQNDELRVSVGDLLRLRCVPLQAAMLRCGVLKVQSVTLSILFSYFHYICGIIEDIT